MKLAQCQYMRRKLPPTKNVVDFDKTKHIISDFSHSSKIRFGSSFTVHNHAGNSIFGRVFESAQARNLNVAGTCFETCRMLYFGSLK